MSSRVFPSSPELPSSAAAAECKLIEVATSDSSPVKQQPQPCSPPRPRERAVRVHFAVDDDETDSKAKPAPADAPEPTCKAQSPSCPSISSEEAQSQELEALLSEVRRRRPGPDIEPLELALNAIASPSLAQLWAAIVNGTAKSASFVSAVDFEHYSAFHLALFRALRTKWTRDEAVSLAQADWLSDSVREASGQSVVTRRHVQTSLVNLALWWACPEDGEALEPAARGAWCRDFLAALLACIGRRDAASGGLAVAPYQEVPVGCCVRAALRLRRRMRAAAAASDGSDGEASDSSSASSSASSSSASELELSWSEAAARAILSSLERPDMKVEEGQRRLWDRTHLRRHALANRLRGRLQAGAVTLLDF
eukprot:tig00001177_g7377.t1